MYKNKYKYKYKKNYFELIFILKYKINMILISKNSLTFIL
jgi:hypothetical protein